MICRRCLLRLSRPSPSLSPLPLTQPIKSIHTTSSLSQTAQSPSAAQTSTPARSPPAATSTAAAQPFSAPLQPSPSTPGSDITPLTPAATDKKPRVKSSVAAGTALKGINYFKNKTDPVALEDGEYPDWLWGVLEEKRSGTGGGKSSVDPRIYSKKASQRRAANKRAKRNASLSTTEEASIPIHKQAVDLPSVSTDVKGEGNEALRTEQVRVSMMARRDLTQSMRAQRRSDIKERNFLQGMS